MGALESLIIGIIIILLGISVLFMGYAIWRFALALMGGVYGYIIGASLVSPDQWFLALILGIVVAVALAALAYFLWSVIAVIYGMLLGAGAGAWLALLLNAREGGVIMFIFLVIGGVIGLILAYFLKDQIIMVITAFAGAGAILYGAGLILPDFLAFLYDRNNFFIAFVIYVVMGVIGYIIQSALFSKRLTGTYTPNRALAS
ncbi:MAG: DUF4203 domain-containing protein [Aggregatilineales bacterium]